MNSSWQTKSDLFFHKEILSSDEDAPPGSWHKALGWHPGEAPGYHRSRLPRAFSYGPLGDTDGCKPDPPSYHVPRLLQPSRLPPPTLPRAKPFGCVPRDVKKNVQEVVNVPGCMAKFWFCDSKEEVERQLKKSWYLQRFWIHSPRDGRNQFADSILIPVFVLT